MRKVIVLILAASILSACGAKKSANGAGETAPPAAPVDTQTTPPAQAPSSTTVSQQPGNVVDLTPTLGPVANGTGPISIPQTPIATDHVPPNYDSNVVSIDANEIGKRFTGAQNSDGLLYTGSSTDELLAALRTYTTSVSEVQKRYNLGAAAQIISAKLNSDSFTKDALIELKLKEDGGIKTYNLGGMLDNEAAQKIKVVRAGTTGQQPISGTVKCLDFGGGCKNVMTRLEIGSKGQVGIAYVVFRQNNANLHVEFQEGASESKNSEFRRIHKMLVNTILDQQTEERFDNYLMSSFEVVNGRAGFKIEARARNSEFLGFKSALLAPEVGTAVRVPVSRITKDEDISLDLVKGSKKVSYEVLSSVGDVKLINNNGLGQVRLQLKMRKDGIEAQDVFNLVFMRKIQPIVDINDDLLK